jgi:hypothetical protein
MSPQRKGAEDHHDLQGDIDGMLTRLRGLRCLDSRQEQDRLLYVACLSATRQPARRWQMWLERDLAQAEGAGEPQFPNPPWAA